MLVFRKGETQRKWNIAVGNEDISITKYDDYVELSFKIPVAGGYSDLRVRIGSQDVGRMFDVCDREDTKALSKRWYRRGLHKAYSEMFDTKEDAIAALAHSVELPDFDME